MLLEKAMFQMGKKYLLRSPVKKSPVFRLSQPETCPGAGCGDAPGILRAGVGDAEAFSSVRRPGAFGAFGAFGAPLFQPKKSPTMMTRSVRLVLGVFHQETGTGVRQPSPPLLGGFAGNAQMTLPAIVPVAFFIQN